MGLPTRTRIVSFHNTSRQWIETLVFFCLSLLVYTLLLGRNNYGNEYYAGAELAGAHSWKAFFYGASDFHSTITVDKPPLSLWPSSLAVRLLGLNHYTILFPQVIMGIITAWIIYVIVRKHFSHYTALLSSFFFLICPISFVMFRLNNPDALMLLILTATVYTHTQAISTSQGVQSILKPWQWNLLTGLLMGLSFLTKQLEGLMILPALAIATWILVPTVKSKVSASFTHLTGLILGAGWWTAIVELTPPQNRPYIGSSPNNDFLDLTFNYNGIHRFKKFTMKSGESSHSSGAESYGTSYSDALTEYATKEHSPHHHFTGLSRSHAGIGRLIWDTDGSQIGWFFVPAVIAIIVGCWWFFYKKRGTVGQKSVFVIVSVWLGSLWPIFSFMGGSYHTYYSIIFSTPIAILAALLLHFLWQNKTTHQARVITVIMVLLLALQQSLLRYNDHNFLPILTILTIGLTCCLLVAFFRGRGKTLSSSYYQAIAVSVLLILTITPVIYLIVTLPRTVSGGLPYAGFSDPSYNSSIVVANKANEEKAIQIIKKDASQYYWPSIANGFYANLLQLETGYSSLPMGGFLGRDKLPTLDQLKKWIQERKIHYFVQTSNNHFSKNDPNKTIAYLTQNYSPIIIGDENAEYVKLYDLTVPPHSTQ